MFVQSSETFIPECITEGRFVGQDHQEGRERQTRLQEHAPQVLLLGRRKQLAVSTN